MLACKHGVPSVEIMAYSCSDFRVKLPPDLAMYVGDSVARGKYGSAAEMMRESLLLFQQADARTELAANRDVLLRFTDRINPIKDPRRIMAEAALLLGSHLHADRALYAEISADPAHVDVQEEWVAGPHAEPDGPAPPDRLRRRAERGAARRCHACHAGGGYGRAGPSGRWHGRLRPRPASVRP